MTDAVLDANVLVCAFLVPAGAPATILRRWRSTGDFRLYTSAHILAEVLEALRRPRNIRRYSIAEKAAIAYVRGLASLAVMVEPTYVPRIVPGDPDDDHVVACAVEAGVNTIVSGDRHLLSLGSYAEVTILPPSAFLRRLDAEPGDVA